MRPSLLLAILAAAALMLLSACAGHPAVPATAIQVQSSSPDNTGVVLYRASDTGNLYIINKSTHALLYSGLVRRDDPIVVDTWNNRILVNNAVVSQRALNRNDSFEFRLDRDHPRDRVVERRVIREYHVRD